MKKLILIPFMSIMIILFSSPVFASSYFSDVAGHWAESNIYAAAEANIIHGYPDHTFLPDRQISRAEFVTILAFESGANTKDINAANFTDIDGHWAKDYILWGRENDILSGYEDNTFRPDQSISRQEMALVLYRYITNYYKKELLSIVPEITFSDHDQIGFWAEQAVSAMQRSGIINGKGNNLFDPVVGATRAETTVMMNRFITYYRTDQLVIDTTANIYFNNELKQSNVPVIKQNNLSMIPIRSLLESVGYTIQFYSEANLIAAYRYDRDMEFWLNKTAYYNNGTAASLSASPALINGTTCVPIQETAAAAGMICQIKEINDQWNIYLTGGDSPIKKGANNFYGTANPVSGNAFLGSDPIGFWGTLKNGEMYYGSYVLDNGELLFGYWQNGMLNGLGRSINRYGEFFVGTFSKGIKQSGTLYFTNGSQFIGTFTKNSVNVTTPSTGQYIAADGTVYGTSDTTWSSGMLYESKW